MERNNFYGIQDQLLSLYIDEATASITYLGYAAPGSSTSDAVWKMMRLERVGSQVEVKWADGNDLHDNIWDDRATLTYV